MFLLTQRYFLLLSNSLDIFLKWQFCGTSQQRGRNNAVHPPVECKRGQIHIPHAGSKWQNANISSKMAQAMARHDTLCFCNSVAKCHHNIIRGLKLPVHGATQPIHQFMLKGLTLARAGHTAQYAIPIHRATQPIHQLMLKGLNLARTGPTAQYAIPMVQSFLFTGPHSPSINSC